MYITASQTCTKRRKSRAYLDWRQIQLFSKRDHNGTLFQWSPKINRILIKWQLLSYSILICIQWKLTRIDEQTNKVEVPTLTLWIDSRGKRQTLIFFLSFSVRSRISFQVTILGCVTLKVPPLPDLCHLTSATLLWQGFFRHPKSPPISSKCCHK